MTKKGHGDFENCARKVGFGHVKVRSYSSYQWGI